MHEMLQYLPLVAIALFGGGWAFTRNKRTLTPENVLDRMYADQLEGLEPYLDPTRGGIDAIGFWQATYGVRGLWCRWKNARGWVFICEYAVLQGLADADDLIRMRNNARKVGISSAIYIIEVILARISPNMIAAQGLSALQTYWRMSQEIYAISSSQGFMVGNASLERYL